MEEFAVEGEEPVADACAEDADAGTGDDVVEPVAAVVESQESHSRGYGIGAYADSERVGDAHEFRSHKCGGGVPRGEGVACARVGTLLLDGVFYAVDEDAERYVGCGGDGDAFNKSVLARHFDKPKSHICHDRQVLDVVVGMEIVVAAQVIHPVFHLIVNATEPSVAHTE